MIIKRIFCSLLFSLFSLTNAFALNASNLHEVQLPIPATLSGKILGNVMSLSGSLAAVAATATTLEGSGAVYLYDALQNWRLTAELKSHLNADNFGETILLVDNFLVVTAAGDDSHGNNSGAVYIFEPNDLHQWQQTAKLIAPDIQAGDHFGQGIALVGEDIYIGAPSKGQGKVYIFTRNLESGHWQIKGELEPSDAQAAGFGAAIAHDKQTLIIGAPYTDAEDNQEAEANNKSKSSDRPQRRFAISKGDTIDPGIESGAIYIYQNNAGKWQETARLGASNRESYDRQGTNIAIEGDIIVTSISHKDVFDHLRAGVVYVYKKVSGKWQEDTALVASAPNVGANFGVSFKLLDGQILVGGNKVHADGFNSGQAYLFSRDSSGTWGLLNQLANATLTDHDQFGRGVALGSEKMLIASKHALYVFQDTLMPYYSGVFYSDNSTLHLNEVALAGVGVFTAKFNISTQADDLIVTLSNYHLRTGIETSENKFSASTGQLLIPRLAAPTATGETMFYRVVLQQLESSEKLLFKVLSADVL